MVNQWSISSLASKPSSPGPAPGWHGGSQRLMERVAARNLARTCPHRFFGLQRLRAWRGSVAAVTCPAVFVMGSKDKDDVAEGCPGAGRPDAQRHCQVPSGHAMMGEKLDEVLDTLAAFARKVGRAPRLEPPTPMPETTMAQTHSRESRAAAFYPLPERAPGRHCRRLHFVGSTVALACLHGAGGHRQRGGCWVPWCPACVALQATRPRRTGPPRSGTRSTA